jgi:selenocysteine lyase/cysteine desulfurase
MTGTQNFEGIAGAKAAIDYLVDLGKQVGSPSSTMRPVLEAAYSAIAEYEQQLAATLLSGLAEIPQLRILGLTDLTRLSDRTPTISFVHQQHPAVDIAQRLGQLGMFVGHGNFYALQLTETLGLEPQGVVRVGLMHYNTHTEVNRLLDALRSLD